MRLYRHRRETLPQIPNQSPTQELAPVQHAPLPVTYRSGSKARSAGHVESNPGIQELSRSRPLFREYIQCDRSSSTAAYRNQDVWRRDRRRRFPGSPDSVGRPARALAARASHRPDRRCAPGHAMGTVIAAARQIDLSARSTLPFLGRCVRLSVARPRRSMGARVWQETRI